MSQLPFDTSFDTKKTAFTVSPVLFSSKVAKYRAIYYIHMHACTLLYMYACVYNISW